MRVLLYAYLILHCTHMLLTWRWVYKAGTEARTGLAARTTCAVVEWAPPRLSIRSVNELRVLRAPLSPAFCCSPGSTRRVDATVSVTSGEGERCRFGSRVVLQTTNKVNVCMA